MLQERLQGYWDLGLQLGLLASFVVQAPALPVPGLSATGEVGVQGQASRALAVPLLDSFVVTGSTRAGALAASLPAPIFSAAGKNLTHGAISRSLSVPGLVATGTGAVAPNAGALAVTLTAPTAQSTGTIQVAGALARTLAVPSQSAAGTVSIVGTSARTLAVPTSSLAGSVGTTAELAANLTVPSLSATTAVGTRTGTLTANLASPSISAVGLALVAGSASLPLAAPSVTSAGVVALAGALAATLVPPALSSAGTITTALTVDVTLAVPSSSASATVAVTGTSTRTLSAPSASATSSVRLAGALTATLTLPTRSLAAAVRVASSFSGTLASPSLTAAGTVATGGVTTDGPASVFVPLSAADWVTLGLPAPLVQWGCQDASGALAVAFGASAPLAAVGTGHLYQQSISGWTRKFVGLVVDSTNQAFHYAGSALDIAASESFAWLVYAAVQDGSTTRPIIRFSTNAVAMNLRSDGRLSVVWSGGNNDTTGPDHAGITTVRPYLFYRRSGPNQVGAYTSIRDFTGFYSSTANAGGSKGLGTESGSGLELRCCLAAFWRGTDANTIAATNRSTLATLGWTVT